MAGNSGSGLNLDKIGLLLGALAILVAGVWMVIKGAGDPKHGLVAYGVACVLIGGSALILSFTGVLTKGKPDVKVDIKDGFSVEKVAGILDVPWWLGLIYLGTIGIAALVANTALA